MRQTKKTRGVTRREFLTYSSAAAAGLMLDAYRPQAGRAAQKKPKHIFFIEARPMTGFSKLGTRRTEVVGGLTMSALVKATNWKAHREPLLATEVPSLDKGTWELLKDGRMRTVWPLRKNIKWHDGADFTAQDYVFGWEVALDPNVNYRTRTFEQKIEKAEAPDAYTLVLTWKENFPLATDLFQGNYFPLPRHLLEKDYRKDAKGFNRLPYHTTKFIGVGPYKVVEWRQGNQIVLEAFDQYFLGRPKIDSITWKSVEDDNAVVANILAGQGHFSVRAMDVEQGLVLREQWESKGQGRVYFTPAGLARIAPSTISEPWFKDIRVRRALLHAIDRETIVKTLFKGAQPVAHSLVAERHADVWPLVKDKLRRYAYDPNLALKLLQEAGWKKTADGVLTNDKGERFAIRFEVASDNTVELNIQAVVSDYWKKIGVIATPANERDRILNDPEHRNRWKGVRYTRHNLEHDDLSEQWHSKATPKPENQWIQENESGWSGADDLIDRWEKELRPERRNQILAEIAIRFAEQIPVMPLYNYTEIVTVHKGLQKAGPRLGTGGDNAASWNAFEWDFTD